MLFFYFSDKCFVPKRYLDNSMIVFFSTCSHVLMFIVNDVTFVPSCVFCIFYWGARIKKIGSNDFVVTMCDVV